MAVFKYKGSLFDYLVFIKYKETKRKLLEAVAQRCGQHVTDVKETKGSK